MTLKIRTATNEDLSATSTLHVEAWDAAFRGILPDAVIDRHSVASRLATFERILNDAPMSLLVAEEETGEIVGFCHADRLDNSAMESPVQGRVYMIYVAPDRKRRGLGTRLLDAALHQLRSRGCETVLIWTREELSDSCRFYESCGGAITDTCDEVSGDRVLTGVSYRFDLSED